VIAELRDADPDRRIEFAVADGLTARGDPHLIRLVLINLLGNAWKFTARRDPAVIEVDGLGEDRHVFVVRDNGAGFDMRYVAKLFDPFQRLHSTADFEGTGIGLAIVQRIVQRHGGRIWAESELGVGTTVQFTLPSVRRRAVDRSSEPAFPMVATLREVEAQILLVEDDEDLAGVIMALLADHGLEVVHATTAADAVALGPQLRVEAVILDLHLPDVDGSWVVRELRRLEHFAGAALVVYSAADVEKQRRRDLSLGETLFLTKGRVGPEELADRVVALVSAPTGTREGRTIA
jgi:CheY-like chemotaxis protein